MGSRNLLDGVHHGQSLAIAKLIVGSCILGGPIEVIIVDDFRLVPKAEVVELLLDGLRIADQNGSGNALFFDLESCPDNLLLLPFCKHHPLLSTRGARLILEEIADLLTLPWR